MTTWGYTRVSTTRQASEGESLPVQQRQIEGYAMQHGFDLAGVFVEEGVSGSTPLAERPMAAQLLGKLERGDIVVTPKLDRMFRSAADALGVLEKLRTQGVSLHMIDLGGDVMSNGVSKLVFTILSAVAENERDRIRERVAQVKQDQRRRGQYLGGHLPFGYKAQDGLLVPDPEKTPAREALNRLYDFGVTLSSRRIAAYLQHEYGFSPGHVAIFKMWKDRLAADDPPWLPLEDAPKNQEVLLCLGKPNYVRLPARKNWNGVWTCGPERIEDMGLGKPECWAELK